MSLDDALLDQMQQMRNRLEEMGGQLETMERHIKLRKQNELQSGNLAPLTKALDYHHSQVQGWTRLAIDPEPDVNELQREFGKMRTVVIRYEEAVQRILGIQPSPLAGLETEEEVSTQTQASPSGAKIVIEFYPDPFKYEGVNHGRHFSNIGGIIKELNEYNIPIKSMYTGRTGPSCFYEVEGTGNIVGLKRKLNAFLLVQNVTEEPVTVNGKTYNFALRVYLPFPDSSRRRW